MVHLRARRLSCAFSPGDPGSTVPVRLRPTACLAIPARERQRGLWTAHCIPATDASGG
jgi:hypothetical protein